MKGAGCLLFAFALMLAFTTTARARDAAPPIASSRAAPVGDASIHYQVNAPVAADAGAEDASVEGGGQSQDAGAVGAAKADASKIWASCMEHVPEGASRPKLTNSFPKNGLAGYALALRVNVEHGLGERVLPNGFRIQGDSDAARALAAAGFMLPAPDGGSAPTLTIREQDGKGSTEAVIYFLALPDKPGRHELTLPPIPIAVSRASGEMLTLCTTPHSITIDEPIANEPEAAPRANPPPRPQRELWTLARDVTYGLIIGAIVAAVATWLVLMWLRRPKPPVPPPPPRPPWEAAFESLEEVRRANLVARAKHSEHMDRVSDVVRIYLGDRFGFDGIESTTDEVLRALRRVPATPTVYEEVRRLLQDSDLVKFARWTPTDADCVEVLVTAEGIVRATMPAIGVEAVAPSGNGAPAADAPHSPPYSPPPGPPPGPPDSPPPGPPSGPPPQGGAS